MNYANPRLRQHWDIIFQVHTSIEYSTISWSPCTHAFLYAKMYMSHSNTRALHRGVQYPNIQISKCWCPLFSAQISNIQISKDQCPLLLLTTWYSLLQGPKTMAKPLPVSNANILIFKFLWIISNIQIWKQWYPLFFGNIQYPDLGGTGP